MKCVGKDEHGNRYYEDRDVDCISFEKNPTLVRYNRRWVEYADYHYPLGITTDRVPPGKHVDDSAGWHGWMTYTYEDHPTYTSGRKRFYKPHYALPHTENTSNTPRHQVPPGSPEHPNRLAFM